MASSEGSAHAQWRRFFDGAGGANIFEIIDAAVAVASLDHPAELKQRRERIAQRLYTGGVLFCGTGRVNKDSMKGSRSMAVSKKEDGPSAKTATAPVKNDLARKNSTKPPAAAAADRNKAPAAQPSEPIMEEMLATTKRRLKEGYDDYKDAKRQRGIQLIEAPEMAKQHKIIRRPDKVRCAVERRALLSTTLRASCV